MKIYYCNKCWIYIRTDVAKDDDGISHVDKTTEKCEKCFKEDNPAPHSGTLKTHCKRGHLLADYRLDNRKITRTCKICLRLAEARHREKHPGYHAKYKKKGKDAT